MSHKWNYSGDINREYGGFYWREDGADDYVRAVRITPCSDAGGPDNLYSIEQGSIYIPADHAKRLSAISMFGYTMDANGVVTDTTGTVATPEQARMYIVEAMLAYHGIESDSDTILQIGRAQENNPGGWSPEADIVKPHNLNLQRFVEREYLD
ncbi:hypothetical protein Cp1R7AA1_025 [Mesorhizobium phage Cp1R7A-A1]|nr:hypothetical protein Cp1R7AA1_025 [Mesorhizobium phage Cp1R7A-A1]